jgi:hypothetical protein
MSKKFNDEDWDLDVKIENIDRIIKDTNSLVYEDFDDEKSQISTISTISKFSKRSSGTITNNPSEKINLQIYLYQQIQVRIFKNIENKVDGNIDLDENYFEENKEKLRFKSKIYAAVITDILFHDSGIKNKSDCENKAHSINELLKAHINYDDLDHPKDIGAILNIIKSTKDNDNYKEFQGCWKNEIKDFDLRVNNQITFSYNFYISCCDYELNFIERLSNHLINKYINLSEIKNVRDSIKNHILENNFLIQSFFDSSQNRRKGIVTTEKMDKNDYFFDQKSLEKLEKSFVGECEQYYKKLLVDKMDKENNEKKQSNLNEKNKLYNKRKEYWWSSTGNYLKSSGGFVFASVAFVATLVAGVFSFKHFDICEHESHKIFYIAANSVIGFLSFLSVICGLSMVGKYLVSAISDHKQYNVADKKISNYYDKVNSKDNQLSELQMKLDVKYENRDFSLDNSSKMLKEITWKDRINYHLQLEKKKEENSSNLEYYMK